MEQRRNGSSQTDWNRSNLTAFLESSDISRRLGVTVMTNLGASTRCQSCRFFDDHKVNGGRAADDSGLCRFNPPVSQPNPQGHGLWPVVSARDWCGHFSPTNVDAAE